eukprot:2997019-Amphidinium_carterae.1
MSVVLPLSHTFLRTEQRCIPAQAHCAWRHGQQSFTPVKEEERSCPEGYPLWLPSDKLPSKGNF